MMNCMSYETKSLKGFSLIEAAIVSAGALLIVIGVMNLMTAHVLFERRTQKLASYSQVMGGVQSLMSSIGLVSQEVSLYPDIASALASDFGSLSANGSGNVARLDISPNKGVILFFHDLDSNNPLLDNSDRVSQEGLYYLPLVYNGSWTAESPVLVSFKLKGSFVAPFDYCESPAVEDLVVDAAGGLGQLVILDEVPGGFCTSSPKMNFMLEGFGLQTFSVPLSPPYY